MMRLNLNLFVGRGVGLGWSGPCKEEEGLGPGIPTPVNRLTDRHTTENITFATPWRPVISKNINFDPNNSVVYHMNFKVWKVYFCTSPVRLVVRFHPVQGLLSLGLDRSDHSYTLFYPLLPLDCKEKTTCVKQGTASTF